MKKILIVIQLVRRGGIELIAINTARHLDKNKYEVSFLLVNPDEHQDEELFRELKEEGYKLFSMPASANGYIGKYKWLCGFFKEQSFDIVHSHVVFFSALVLRAARKYGVTVRVAHSHIAAWNRKENLKYKIYKIAMRNILNRNATCLLACSEAAGAFLYGKKAFAKRGIFLPNGIDTKAYAYSEIIRDEKREELGISSDELVIGHVGTIYRIKNQVFLVSVLKELLQKNYAAKLVLVGELVDTEPVISRATELGISDKVIMLGQRADVNNILQAFDVMAFPSLHEGLPVALIEAQASKLSCLVSDTITREVKLNDNVEFISLNDSAANWAKEIIEISKINRNEISIEKLVSVYDIHEVTKHLESIYCNCR